MRALSQMGKTVGRASTQKIWAAAGYSQSIWCLAEALGRSTCPAMVSVVIPTMLGISFWDSVLAYTCLETRRVAGVTNRWTFRNLVLYKCQPQIHSMFQACWKVASPLAHRKHEVMCIGILAITPSSKIPFCLESPSLMRNGMLVISKVQSVQIVGLLLRWRQRPWAWVMRTKRNQWWFTALVAFAVPLQQRPEGFAKAPKT